MESKSEIEQKTKKRQDMENFLEEYYKLFNKMQQKEEEIKKDIQ
jgi:hypothetical protein